MYRNKIRYNRKTYRDEREQVEVGRSEAEVGGFGLTSPPSSLAFGSLEI